MPAKVQFKEGVYEVNGGVWEGEDAKFVKWLNLVMGQDATGVATSEQMDMELADFAVAEMGAKIIEKSPIVTDEIM